MSKEQTFERKEIKYLLSDQQYRLLLPELTKYAEVDKYGKTRINNIYYDTPNFQLIRASLEKPVYKEKLRLRTYGDTDGQTPAFIEIKKKYKGIVYKRRVSFNYDKSIDYLAGNIKLSELEKSQVTDEIDELVDFYQGIRPAMVIGYDRIAMAGTYDKDFRVTFDTNITWRVEDIDLKSGSQGKRIIEKNQYLMEIKIPDAFPIELSQCMSRLGIFPVSISKYGRGYIQYIMEASQNMTQSDVMVEPLLHHKGEGEVAYA
ncbi:MAG: polyphosphate polymerase domain-containing protein [Eubacterium sp.]|nr:polyphosphate polymerase domain-containing protein [Eubacterium sp.]